MQLAGGGKKRQKSEPPVYKPPIMGELQYGASYSYAEILDLVSDGPIEGLCNRFGQVMQGVGMLQGIYLDDTPIAVTQASPDINPNSVAGNEGVVDTAEVQPSKLSDSVGTGAKNCQLFFKALNQQKYRSPAGMVSTLRKDGSRGDAVQGEVVTQPNVNMMVVKQRNSSSRCSGKVPASRDNRGYYFRAYIRKESEGAGSLSKAFTVWTNGTSRTEYNSNSNAGYRSTTIRKNHIRQLGWGDCATFHRNAGFPAGTASQTIKFYMGYGAGTSGFNSNGRMLWHENYYTIARVIDGYRTGAAGFNSSTHDGTNVTAIRTILSLYNDNNVDNNPDANPYQRLLAAKALGQLGWSNSTSINPVVLIRDLLQRREDKKWVAVVKVDTYNANLKDKKLIDGEGNLIRMWTYPFGLKSGWGLYQKMRAAGIKIVDATCPVVDENGVATGDMYGFILFQFAPYTAGRSLRCSGRQYGWATNFGVPKIVKDLFSELDCFYHAKEFTPEAGEEWEHTNQKYNYTNVLAEFRRGDENQRPFDYFRSVFIDHKYNATLFGPFSSKSQLYPQRIEQNADMLTKSKVLRRSSSHNFNLEVGGDGLPENEGSDDERVTADNKTRDYSSWAKSSVASWDELAVPLTHYIYNPNVRRCFITLNITSLSDTLIKDVDNVGGSTSDNNDLKVGTKFPTVLNLFVETGSVNKDGEDVVQFTYTYRVVALIEGPTLIDIGNPDYKGDSSKEYIISLDSNRTNLAEPFHLPEAISNKQVLLNTDGTQGFQADSIDQDSVEKRFIRVTKLSFETNSVLLNKDVSVDKVTEIIDADLTYPFSAIIGTKLDSRAFQAIPARSFDLKLKKVKVPANYNPTFGGKDKRYWSSKYAWERINESSVDQRDKLLVYDGDWDGSWHEELRWTDNPAWILYDLLTNQRYGMGSHIDIDSINIWQLYQIGRFCDAVDDDGYFVGVTDGRGGLEPRFSCNVVFDQGQKIYDAINTISKIFNGRTFFSNSEINFVDDRPRLPVNLFTNESVKDGLFYYSNNRRDQQFNTIEVGYKDRFDNFAPKIEVIEDEDDIKERGIFKVRIEGVGITSRAMARRVGQHEAFSKIQENQTVAFTAGLESLLCQPGDLITIEDELKTNKANFGKILDVDLDNEIIRLSNTFVTADMAGRLTVFNPTGRNTLDDVEDLAFLNRTRYASFTVTGYDGNLPLSPTVAADPWVSGATMFTGDYSFSGFTLGYPDLDNTEEQNTPNPRFGQYALYTGAPKTYSWDYPYIYFETGVTGWVFASGWGNTETAGGLPDARSLFSGTFISKWTGMQTLGDLGTGEISVLDMTQPDKRADSSSDPSRDAYFSGFDDSSFVGPSNGVYGLNQEGLLPTVVTPDQMTVLTVTGGIISTPTELESSGFSNYGSVVSGVDKPELLPFLKLGSAAKFEIKDSSPFIYKVVALKEDGPNEYLVSATKYDTGKFKYIEDNESIESLVNTYSYQTAQTVNDITYSTLDTPNIHSVTTGVPNASSQTFTITGIWNAVTYSTGYNVVLTYPNGETEDVSINATGHEFTGLSQVGVFNYSVNALGNRAGEANSNAYFDSQYDTSGIFVVYDELLEWSASFIERIAIL